MSTPEPKATIPVKGLVVAALVLGVTAAALVWWLERFQVDKLHSEVHDYLEKYDEFRQWLAQQRPGQSEGGQP